MNSQMVVYAATVAKHVASEQAVERAHDADNCRDMASCADDWRLVEASATASRAATLAATLAADALRAATEAHEAKQRVAELWNRRRGGAP
jgi:hypothetical protein